MTINLSVLLLFVLAFINCTYALLPSLDQRKGRLGLNQRSFRTTSCLVGKQEKICSGGLFAFQEENEDSALSGTNNSTNLNVSISERCQVISYRLTLFLASLGYGGLFAATVLQGSGLGFETLQSIQVSSNTVIHLCICITALIIPSYRGEATDDSNSLRKDSPLSAILVLNKVLPILAALAIVSELISSVGEIPSSYFAFVDIDKLFLNAALSGVCIREILFYGLAFKVEAALAVALLAFDVVGEDLFQAAVIPGGLALTLLVLSVGKIFEPIRSDMVPDQSSFFLNDSK